MKKLIILAVITAITSLYFIVDAQHYLVFQSKVPPKSEVTPLGTDIVDLAAKKLPEIVNNLKSSSQNSLGNKLDVSVPVLENQLQNIPEKAGNLVTQAVNNLRGTVSSSIQQKIDQTFCLPPGDLPQADSHK